MDLADLYTANGNFEAAEVQWQAFERKRGMFLFEFFPGVTVMGWLGRALVAEARQDKASALQYAKKVVDHWGKKNPQLKIVKLAREVMTKSV